MKKMTYFHDLTCANVKYL